MTPEASVCSKVATVEETMVILKLGRSTVGRLYRSGELECIKVGRSIRIPLDAIDRFMARQMHDHHGRDAGQAADGVRALPGHGRGRVA